MNATEVDHMEALALMVPNSEPRPILGPNVVVHPLAAAFPMMPDDELAELADDILTNGQREPIKLDQTGRLIDGRNRLKGCKIAGVEPWIETFEGDEDAVIAYIHSVNINRRHMSKGQRAMATAMAYPDTQPGKRSTLSKIEKVSVGALSEARTVLRDDPEAAKSVMAGAMPLHEAYEAAKQKVTSEASRRAAMDNLRARYADLAEKVEREELSFKAAVVEANDRDERARNQRDTIFKAVRQACEALAVLAFEEGVAELARQFPDEFAKANPLGTKHLLDRAQHAAEGARRLDGIISQLSGEGL